MFDTVLVANRGEIARRVIRTLRRLGIRSVAVFSDADAGAPHVREADVAVRIGPPAASASYLDVGAIMAAAVEHGARAVHPGYGFLSESAALARACAEAGIVFIGPGVEALEVMGDKARSRDHVSQRGVPVVPGFDAAGLTDAEIAGRAVQTGFPLLVKPSAGGGGKGMEIVEDEAGLASALSAARRVARSSFGDDALILERLLRRPRHLEVQVFGDAHGRIVAVGERECTLQRRHQKVIEEAPAAIDAALRARLWEEAVRVAESVQYVGAGTVEFLVDADAPGELFFIEMNTRLQVEHPVTEAVTGLDLVELQLRVAAGEPLPEIPPVVGHAVEARVYAESPERGFMPSTGTVLRFDAPPGVRVDAAVETGSEVTGFYDPMIAKVIATGADRGEALARLDAALGRTIVLGVETNISFLRLLCSHGRVVAGDLDTGLIETMLPVVAPPVSEGMLIAASAAVDVERETGAANEGPSQLPGSVWSMLRGWRLSATEDASPRRAFLTDAGEMLEASAHGAGAAGHHAVAAIGPDSALWVAEDGRTVRLRPLTRRQRMDQLRGQRHPEVSDSQPEVSAPMPGTVVAVHAADGDTVRAGQVLVSIEAMKMEHAVTAPHDGTVRVLVAQGDQVRRDQTVARVETEENDD
ncbi:acetyl/propionyl/methylcrotonyl-CoA carboxylase subunit alpha [Microbacterium sp. NPDC055903]